MKILIFGAKGNLGSQLADIYKEAEVFGWDKNEVDITDEIGCGGLTGTFNYGFKFEGSGYQPGQISIGIGYGENGRDDRMPMPVGR